MLHYSEQVSNENEEICESHIFQTASPGAHDVIVRLPGMRVVDKGEQTFLISLCIDLSNRIFLHLLPIGL